LCKEIQVLLLTTFGVISSRQPIFNILGLYYRVTVYPNEFGKIRDSNLLKYLDTSVVPDEMKFSRFLSTKAKVSNPDVDLIPYLKAAFLQIKQKLPIAKNGKLILNGKGVAKIASPQNCFPSNDSLAPHDTASEILQYCGDILEAVESSGEVFLGQCGWYQELKMFTERCQTLLQSQWFFSKVSDLRHIPLPKRVYDFHVPQYHSFWSNGITSHNTSAARILAAMENCAVSPGVSPCGKCDVCKRIFAGTHTDIEEVDAASSAGSVEHVRKLKNSALYNPIDGCRTKYFIIDECLPYDALVSMAGGSKRKIGELVEGGLSKDSPDDVVLSRDMSMSGKSIQQDVCRYIKIPNDKQMYEVEIKDENGKVQILRITGNHNVFVQNKGKVKAEDLKIGQKVFLE